MNTLGHYYLLFKALHIAFMVTWFAGLFYLPRLFIYHAEAEDAPGRERFCTMERRLFAIMTLGAGLTLLLGLLLMGINYGLLDRRWLHVKLLLVLGLFVYHYRCFRWIQRLRDGEKVANTRWLRWFNEIPVFFLLTIIVIAVLKPL